MAADAEPEVVRLPELMGRLVPASRTSIWRWIRTEGFPKPIALGPRAKGWYVAEVRAWLETRRNEAHDSSSQTR